MDLRVAALASTSSSIATEMYAGQGVVPGRQIVHNRRRGVARHRLGRGLPNGRLEQLQVRLARSERFGRRLGVGPAPDVHEFLLSGQSGPARRADSRPP